MIGLSSDSLPRPFDFQLVLLIVVLVPKPPFIKDAEKGFVIFPLKHVISSLIGGRRNWWIREIGLVSPAREFPSSVPTMLSSPSSPLSSMRIPYFRPHHWQRRRQRQEWVERDLVHGLECRRDVSWQGDWKYAINCRPTHSDFGFHSVCWNTSRKPNARLEVAQVVKSCGGK